LKDKPFALIGVNVNEFESKNLKERMDKEKMNWRSFAHQDAVNAKWKPSTPSYYVLDPKGVIRHKWVGAPGEKAIDTALEKLINEAQEQQPKPAGEMAGPLPKAWDYGAPMKKVGAKFRGNEGVVLHVGGSMTIANP
jgi:hypothetical protein